MELSTAQWTAADGWSAPLPDWDDPATLVLAFGGSKLLDDPGPLAEVAAAYPRSRLVGCSSAGEIHGETLSDDTLTVAVARLAVTRLHLAHEIVDSPADSWAAGRSLARRLAAQDPELRSVFVLADGLGVNGSALTAGLVEGAGPDVVITGGMAGDGADFARTWVAAEGAPRQGCISAVGLSGAGLRVGHGSRGGWDIFGPERRITRSEGSMLYELDGQPALELYKKYLGERAAGLPATALLFPLAEIGRAHV